MIWLKIVVISQDSEILLILFLLKKEGVFIWSIGKKENLYVKEFIEYYLLSEIKKILLYDNNDINGESFKDILKDNYSKRAHIIDVRGMTSIQILIYNHCYKNNNNNYFWIGFIDLDEYSNSIYT